MAGESKISVITWDGGFREHFHTVDSFSAQSLPKDRYEFIWVSYRSDVPAELREKVAQMGNGRIICLNGKGEWHLGRCLNEGIRQSHGDIVVIPDGDIVVEPDFLKVVSESFDKTENLVLYFRRWDELESDHTEDTSYTRLSRVCMLRNPSNYGGCLATSRVCLRYVQGYEEHPVFCGAGASGLELYTRLKNAGFPIVWHPMEKIYHPWHTGTLTGPEQVRQNQQYWVIKQKDLAVDYKADEEKTNRFLATFPMRKKNEIRQSYDFRRLAKNALVFFQAKRVKK